MPSQSNTAVPESSPNTILTQALPAGFISTLVLWATWFATHVPWVGLPENQSLPLILALWMVSLVWVGWRATDKFSRVVMIGASAGAIAAVVGLLLLGSKLTQTADATAMNSVVAKPSAPVIAAAFVAFGAVLGAICSAIGANLPSAGTRPAMGLHTFAFVTIFAGAPLLFVGGLVTSTNSGMAVPDWPNTYGTNMFLYPLGPRVPPDIFFEHSHRLFGTLFGLTGLVLLVWVMVVAKRNNAAKSVRILTVAAFVGIVAQGALGGVRVLMGSKEHAADNRWLSMFHGVLAQLVFALVVAIAVKLLPRFLASLAEKITATPSSKKLRILATAAMHSSILQLLLGAMYRHLRSTHVLWTHIAFAFIVAGFGLLAGMLANNIHSEDDAPKSSLTPTARRLGMWVVVCVALQFSLGWATFLFGGKTLQAESTIQAILRTAHQANGAAMFALLTAMFLVARRLAPKK